MTKNHIPIEEARALLYEYFAPLAPKRMSVLDENILGCTLAQDVMSINNVPQYPVSAVDGYAVRSCDTADVTPYRPKILPESTYQWVNTGAPIPAEFDCVIMIEDTAIEEKNELRIVKALFRGANVRAPGEDVMCAQVLAYAGDEVTPIAAALFLCAGVKEISVQPKLNILYIPTGDEIISARDWLEGVNKRPGTAAESNSLMLKGMIAQWGQHLDVSPVIKDDKDALFAALKDAAQKYDIVLIGAGSSKGKRDYTEDAIKSADEKATSGKAGIIFHWLLTKPARPAMAAYFTDERGVKKPVINMPGFPMSSMVTAWGILYPLIRHMSGRPLDENMTSQEILSEAVGQQAGEKPAEARIITSYTSSFGMEEWVRFKAADIGGKKICWPAGSGASSLFAMNDAHAIAIFDRNTLEIERGSVVKLQPIKNVTSVKNIKNSNNNTILFQGSDDPAFLRVISFMRKKGFDMTVRSVGSMGGLVALSNGEAHAAAYHLLDEDTGIYNDAYIEKFDKEGRFARKIIFYREQGFIVRNESKKSEKSIKSVSDVAALGLNFANRQNGAGTRVLLDYLLKKESVERTAITGYDVICTTHLEAANRVACGMSDVTLGIKAAALAFGLDFIPIALEPYELIFDKNYEQSGAIQALLSSLEDDAWRAQVMSLGGYRWQP